MPGRPRGAGGGGAAGSLAVARGDGPGGGAPPALPRRRAAAIADAILCWYRGRSRDLPWRDDPDPWRVWVAEVMAQQTRVGTVKAYWGAFVERFPTPRALAEAEPDDVMKAWEGLGYYARARNLQRAAREVVTRHGGVVPPDPETLRLLPGIGRYTAAAVASLAYGRPAPAVDGNARRVLARLFDLEAPRPAALEALLGAVLRSRPEEASALNQAFMDLGGAVCRPRRPDCPPCPLRRSCLARRRGTVERRPLPRVRRDLPHRRIAVGLVWREGRLLIARRPPRGLLGGLWEFPGGEVEPGETPAGAARREVREETGIEVEVGRRAAVVRHAYSHFRITLHAFHGRWISGEPAPRSATALAWVAPERLSDYAFPAANARIVAGLANEVARRA